MQLTFKDVLEVFQISEKEANDWIEKKKMPFFMANEQRYFNYIALLDWALSSKIKLTPEVLALGEREKTRCEIVCEGIKKGGIFYDIPGKNRIEVIKTIVDLLPLAPKTDKKLLESMLISREKLTSTGIGSGIAIPHVRNPVVLSMDQPSITLCFLKEPVDFKAIDHKPVHIVFTLLTPTVKEHMAIISRLAFCLQNARLLEFLHTRAKPEEILGEFQVLDSMASLRFNGSGSREGKI